jgi:hypothetical protein
VEEALSEPWSNGPVERQLNATPRSLNPSVIRIWSPNVSKMKVCATPFGDGNMPSLSTLFLQGFWRRTEEENGTWIAWMQEGRKPSAELAVFYFTARWVAPLEDGLDQYHYHDKGLKPPKRSLKSA